jgi:hypothetical protein
MVELTPIVQRREGFQNVKIQGFINDWPKIGRARLPPSLWRALARRRPVGRPRLGRSLALPEIPHGVTLQGRVRMRATQRLKRGRFPLKQIKPVRFRYEHYGKTEISPAQPGTLQRPRP